MSNNKLLLNIYSKYILQKIFSYLKYHYILKLIKYNKNLQKKLDIIFEDSIINYKYYIKTKKEKEVDIEEDIFKKMKKSRDNYYSSGISFSSKFYLRYSYFFPENINEDDKIIFLIKYKGFKINDFPLPYNFNEMKTEDKINILEKNEDFFKYTLNNEQMELINLIFEFRKNNNIGNLIYSQIENLCDYFKHQKLNNEKYLLIYPIGEMKKKLLEKDTNIISILSIEYMKNIIILEKGNNEYIFIYSDYNKKDNLEMPIKFDNNLKLNSKFHLINNIIPELKIALHKELFFKRLRSCLNYEGFQILDMKDDFLIGVLEGPPDTPYENGYFLFKIIFTKDFPLKSPRFIFISVIFHPNISENGFVSIDIFEKDWSPAISNFPTMIYSIQSLLDDPNPDDFINEKAAKLYKENKIIYNQTVREYTFQFANYSKFQEDCKKLNLNKNF